MEKVINVFLSQPMNGVGETEVLNNMVMVREWISGLTPVGVRVHIIDNYHHTTLPPEKAHETAKRLWYLGQSIQLLGDADLMVLYMPRAMNHFAKGCRVELKVCETYAIPVFDIFDLPPQDEVYSGALKRLLEEMVHYKFGPSPTMPL